MLFLPMNNLVGAAKAPWLSPGTGQRSQAASLLAPGLPAAWVLSQPSTWAIRIWILGVRRYFSPLGIAFSPLAPLPRAVSQFPQAKRDISRSANTQPERRAAKYTGNLPSPSSRLGFKPGKSSVLKGFPSALQTLPQSSAMPLSSAMLEVAWLRNIIPRDSHSGIYGRKAFGRGGEKTSSGERPSKSFKPAKFEGTGEVLAGVSGSRAAVSLACAERCTTWAETRCVARAEAGCVAQGHAWPRGRVTPCSARTEVPHAAGSAGIGAGQPPTADPASHRRQRAHGGFTLGRAETVCVWSAFIYHLGVPKQGEGGGTDGEDETRDCTFPSSFKLFLSSFFFFF